jgi:hypothetical protein
MKPSSDIDLFTTTLPVRVLVSLILSSGLTTMSGRVEQAEALPAAIAVLGNKAAPAAGYAARTVKKARHVARSTFQGVEQATAPAGTAEQAAVLRGSAEHAAVAARVSAVVAVMAPARHIERAVLLALSSLMCHGDLPNRDRPRLACQG